MGAIKALAEQYNNKYMLKLKYLIAYYGAKALAIDVIKREGEL